MAICANCGAELPPRFRYCGACGAPLAFEPEHEMRKLVTIFFCDLVDSTALGERLDPELVRRVLRRYFGLIERLILEHGGLVEKFIGDAVMAVFGLPSAHEDDALRAVKAAAEIRARLPELHRESGFEFSFRIGINSGEVAAGSGQTLATGDPVNLAARLEQAAAPGEILLGAETVRLLGRAVEAEPLAPLELQGKTEPVQAFRFRALVTAAEQPHSPFRGRRRELSLLREALERAAEERELHLVTLLGPAGIGKSRLASEFLASLDGQTQVARGRCLSYGQALSYWPLLEVLRTLGPPAEEALERLLEGGATSPQQLAWAVQQALEQAAAERALLVMLEDLHWAEPALLDLLDRICELSRDAPILLLCLARPELLEQRPHWGGGKLNATSLLLEPLPDEDSASLLSSLECPPERKQRALALAAGNPLFLEELSAFLAEGGSEHDLPPRIQALLQARLDLLTEPQQQLLATAALEGIVFHRGALETLLSEEQRAELQSELATLTRTLLVRPATPEFAGEQAFRFRHQLIRDTAYGELPKSERARLHERFADWLEQHRGEREELEELVAYHLEQAALTRRELGEAEPVLEQRAADALAAAAERARLRSDLHAATGLWRRARALLEDSDPRVPDLELELALVLPWLSQFGEAQRLLEHAVRQTADPSVAAAARLAGLQARLHSAPEGVLAAIRGECAEAIPLFEERGEPRRLALAWYMFAQAEMADLQVGAAAQAWANAAAHAQLAGDRGFEMITRGESTERIGLETGSWTATTREFERLAEEFPGEPVLELVCRLSRAFSAYFAGRPEEARPLVREVVNEAHGIGMTWYAPLHIVGIGKLEMLCGDLDEAERLAPAGIRELRELDERFFLGEALPWLADIRIAQGRYAEALELATEAEQHRPDDRKTLVAAGCVRARAHAHLAAIEDAKAAAAAAVALAESTDSLWARAEAQYALAKALASAGELPAALAAAEETARLYETMERRVYAQRARTLAGEIKGRTSRVREPTTTT